MALRIPDCTYSYTADFVYVDETHNLYIDIEIDEPYIYGSGEPIHYLGKDDQRNTFFMNKGWVTIRFAEKQVCQTPDQCCLFIAEQIHQLLQQPIPITLQKYGHPKPILCWTEQEARQMAFENYRNQY